ncbi:hypothetical protein RB653_009447 [Dictyostelium firmibasis]|uniref:EGF-like domain-containing protein n=1 Tax=Dictyostelium firmibasis TaxID=79012 RepID=A0AAN7U223_9MYCE
MNRNRLLFLLFLLSLLYLVDCQYQLKDLSSDTEKIKYFDSLNSTCNFKIPILVTGQGKLVNLIDYSIPRIWLPFIFNSTSTLFITNFNLIEQGSKNFNIVANGNATFGSISINLTCLAVDTSLLSYKIIKPVFWSSTYKYSSIISIDGLPNGSTFGFDNSSINVLLLNVFNSTPHFRVEFKEKYYFLNHENSLWPINLSFKGSQTITINIPFNSPKTSLDSPLDIKTFPTFSNVYDYMGDIFGGAITFRSVSINQRPTYSLYSSPSLYTTPRPISGNENNITYIVYCRRLTSGVQTFYLNSFVSSSGYNFSTTSQLTFDLTLLDRKGYDFQTYQYQFKFGSYVMNLPFPYGFRNGTNSLFDYSASFQTTYKSSISPTLLRIDGDSFLVSSKQIVSPVETSSLSVHLTEIGDFKYILRIICSNTAGIKYFIIPLNNGLVIKIDNSNSISNSVLYGVWEYLFDIFSYGSDYLGYITVVDYLDGQKQFSLDYQGTISNLSYSITLPKIDLKNCNYLQDITNISFLNNNVDLTNQNVYNMMYFSFGQKNSFYSSKSIGFFLSDPKSLRDQGFDSENSKNFDPKLMFAQWDSVNNRFSVTFKMPANTVPGQLDYSIVFSRDDIIQSVLLPMEYQLNVTCSNVDIQGPMITNIVYKYNPSFTDAISFGWTITIEDSINGFDYGYVIIRGVIDNSLYNISFSSKNGKIGNKLKDNYDILIELDKTQKCIPQYYNITYVHLVDRFGNEATFYKHVTDIELNKRGYSYDSTGNPLINFITQQSLLGISSPQYCNYSQIESTISLVSFTSNISQMDSGLSNRSITFDFVAKDSIWGLKKDQFPIVYLVSDIFKSVQCVSKIISLNNDSGVYQCTIGQLPLGFGFPTGLSLSVYGFINNGGQFAGFSTSMLNSSGFQSFIDVPNYNSNTISITGVSEVNNLGGDFLIYGTAFSLINSVKATFSNGSQYFCDFTAFQNSVIKVLKFPAGINDPFTIIGNGVTNEFLVTPINYNFNYTPIETQSPIVTSSPQKCKGSPECGGTSNGYCSISGCVCYPPWIGIDCTSQIITVPPPLVDSEKPATSIDVPNKSNGNNITSIISIVALREINSINGEEIKIHYFGKWLYSNISQSVSQYTSNITNGGKTTTVVATLEWFTVGKNISFANEQITMNPFSMKYTIELSSYAFTNSLSHLQVVMSAQIQSSEKNICSNKDFGNTTTQNLNYIKLQVASNSFYGRYIKRGIVDGKIVNVENEILDSKFNVVQAENTVQSYIGILIGKYENYATIDPDFSILIDSNSANSNSPNSICAPNSKLKTNQLVGIIIGSVGFLTLLIIIIFLMYKSSHCLFIKIIFYKITRKSKL